MKIFKKYLLSLMMVSVLFGAVQASAVSSQDTLLIATNDGTSNHYYSDVADTWCEKWVSQYGYSDIFGNSDDLFSPQKPITRMEFARMLHRALAININYFAATDISEYYNDVSNSDEGASALYDLVICGIIDTKTSFSPTEPLSRQEMIHFIMNAYSFKSRSDSSVPSIERDDFTDEADIKTEYAQDVDASVALGLINGKGDNKLCPLDSTTRAEAVTVAGRLVELTSKASLTDVVVTSTAKENAGELTLNLSIINGSENTITITHNSQKTFDFALFDSEGAELYRWSKDRMFPMVVTTVTLKPAEEKTYSVRLDADAYASIKDKIASGKAYITGTSTEFSVNQDGYLISFPKQ